MDWHLCYGPDSQSLLPSHQRPAASLKVMLRTIISIIWSYYEAPLSAYAPSALFWQLLADPLTLAHHHSLNFGEISTANPPSWYWTSDPLCSGDTHDCSIILSHLQSDPFQESFCTEDFSEFQLVHKVNPSNCISTDMMPQPEEAPPTGGMLLPPALIGY